MKILIAIALVFITFIIVTLFACLRVASREDEIMERMRHNSTEE